MNQNTKQNKRERNRKIRFFILFYFFTTEKIEVVGMEVNLHYFSIASKN